MWIFRTVIAVTAVCVSSIQSATVNAANTNQTGKPFFFHDDFSLDQLDASKWNATDLRSTVDGEVQYYSPDNVHTANNTLVIAVKGEAKGGAIYTSGRVDTRDQYVFTYGQVEIRARMPKGRGILTSPWLAHNTCLPAVACANWPPAIKLLDFRGERVTEAHSTLFLKVNDTVQTIGKSYSAPADLTADFHTYALHWSPTKLAYSLDGHEYLTIDDPAKIPSDPMRLVITVAVVGSCASVPNASTQMTVKYVKITPIDKDATATPRTAAAKPPPSGADPTVYGLLPVLLSAVISSAINRLLI